MNTVSLLMAIGLSAVSGQIDFDRQPIDYSQATSQDPVVQLQTRLHTGAEQLKYDSEHGYLPAVLDLLDIPHSSQVLVYSKTSFQLRRISPRRPRALYFNDTSYVGWVQNGDVLEIMTTDPDLGEVFYTLSQERQEHPRFIRDRGQCTVCHASSRTQGVPGGLVRSAYVNLGGQPQFGAGTFTVDHRSPFEERWGGWYVTGTHGEMRHMGNVVSQDRHHPESIDREAGANLTDLSDRLDITPYLTGHSDLVALMVLEHQTQMQNFLTLANYECRSAIHYDGVMNKAFDRPEDQVSDTSKRRIAAAGEKLLRYMLMADEFQLTSPVKGSSKFASEFSGRGPRDQKGRSLRDLDLQTRMFKYPCSYLIYSRSFDHLPLPIKRYVVTRLHEVLTGADSSEEFSHLSTVERRAIREILTDTRPELWRLVERE